MRRKVLLNGEGRVGPRPFLYALLPVAIAMVLRVYPYLFSGLPFSVDSWPSIKYAELLLSDAPIRVGEAAVLGKSPDYFGEKVFGAVVSMLTGLRPMHAMALLVPVTGALSALMLYAIAMALYGRGVALLASLLLATAISDVILTAGVKGETYARSLYLLLIYLLLSRGLAWRSKTSLFALASASLVAAHYYTAILATAMMASTILGITIVRAKEGLDLEVRELALPAILASSTLAYFALYAKWAFDFVLAIDWPSAASYQVVAFSLALWLAMRPRARSGANVAIPCSLALLALFIAWLSTVRPLAPGAPVLPARYLLYASPFIVIAPLCALGCGEARGSRSELHVAPLFWLATVLGLECYAIFGNVDPVLGTTLAYRGLNFLIPPLAMLSALGVRRLYEGEERDGSTPKRSSRGLSKAVAIATALFVLSANAYGVYACVGLQERYLGYFWLYTQPEYRAAAWVGNVASNATVAGDAKAFYLLKCYFGVEVDVLEGLKYLSGKGRSPQALFVYEQMQRNGYVVWGGYSVDLPSDWMERARNLSQVYSNGVASIYAK